MKYRIRVVGIVQRDDEVLFLKRRQGRMLVPAKWELPTAKIGFGEQPEEAMGRVLLQELGLKADDLKLKDVVTFLAPEGASQLNNLYIIYDVVISKLDRITLGERYTGYKYVRDVTTEAGKLDAASASVLAITTGEEKLVYREAAHGATVFVDGASRGNPGPSGIGYYIIGEDGQVLRRGGEFIGFASSRVAEYYALKEGVEQAMELGLKNVRFVGDNLMMMNQMRGIYKIKNQDLKMIFDDIKKMLPQFESCAFIHVNREDNREADREANQAIDRRFQS